jgi:hypothetical protein
MAARSLHWIKAIGPATDLLLAVAPGEGVDPSSATNRIAALAFG